MSHKIKEHKKSKKHKNLILIVDDNKAHACLLKLLLKQMGNYVKVAYNGGDALRMTKALRPDVILLDVMLPDLDGYTVLKEIRQQENGGKRGERIPVIMQSARGLPTEVLCETEGISSFLHKPFDKKEMLEALSTALSTK